MKLESITIAGFKSFAKKTTIQVPAGITAIVGPNGSGKSNIADAVRWVLGEQSMKTLRGKKSDDVIFAGTEKKSRLGAAEVTLTLKNDKKNSKIKFQKVAITRRVFRDGDGEYLINKNKVRLIDVQELLAQAGFGQQTYGVIGQGMIDSLLKASPKELREMFYDACGVRAFHIKKTQAEKKLARTKLNILRGKDVIAEIEPHLRALSRIASKAEKYKKATAERDQVFDTFFHAKITHLNSQKDQIIKQIAELQKNAGKKEKELTHFREKRSEFIHGTAQKEKRIYEQQKNEIENQIAKIEKEIYVTEGGIEIEKERQKPADTSYLESQISENAQKQKKEHDNSANAKAQIKNTTADLDRAKKAYHAQQDKVGKAEEALKNFQKSIRVKRVTLSSIKEEIAKNAQKYDKIFDHIAACKTLEDLEKIKKSAKIHQADYQKILSTLEQGERGNVMQKQEALQKSIEVAKSELQQRQSAVQEISHKIKFAQNTLSIHERMLKESVEQGEKLKKRLSETRQQKADSEKINTLQKKRAQLQKDKAAKEDQKKEIQAKLTQAVQQFDQIQKGIQEIEDSFEEVVSSLNQLKDEIRSKEIDRAEIQSQIQQVSQEIISHLGFPKGSEKIETYNARAKNIPEQELKSMRKRLNVALSTLNRIGDIDEDALHEYEEIKKRHQFLTEQEADLLAAEKKLKKVISELNVTIEKTFNQSFDSIAKRFKTYFKILFGGGSARITKTKAKPKNNEDDQEEKQLDSTVIEIYANPPGKKLQNLSMMSGGERALTSIALLMSIIENNPPPFVVLDEVDAALDEANSERFSKILLDAKKKSQVIAITHNRATMNKAQVLYGVTMQESGVSKLLSVKLEKALLAEKKN